MSSLFFFFFQAEDGIRDVAVTGVQTCALPISGWRFPARRANRQRCSCHSQQFPPGKFSRPSHSKGVHRPKTKNAKPRTVRSEEHTSELQSRLHLVCRLLLEKKKKTEEQTALQA